MKTVWEKLTSPFFVQAPMEDVTDTVFRQVLASVGKPDLYFTEFTNADGIIKGGERYIHQRLKYTDVERPLIAQIWGKNPDHYFKAAKILKDLSYDGIDINMGCPDKKIVKNGCCAGLINNPNLAQELYLAANEGAGNSLPVSIKTRIGYNKIVTEDWIGFLLTLKPAAITVHARTASEMSKVPAHFEEFGKAVNLRNKISKKTTIVANGDILDKNMGEKIVKNYGVDGIMIGRGMLHNPWVFSGRKTEDISIYDRLNLLKKHISLFDTTWENTKNFEIMKKFYKAYLAGFEGASEMRLRLMEFHTAKDTISEIDIMLK
ncbi:MAG: tRNA-dihydrouridine synthase [Candidatus Levybacteria bacterium]|nr:tRNA-dihydrouridine synthase [Candidatus Levybacteria bacterium]MBP9815065.1 tRNA-dihydrouridine synthase [Candidatus Levybacteria bacterium]